MAARRRTARKVVRTRVDRSIWDHRLSPNPHALAIYLEFVPARGVTLERFEECQCEDDDVRLRCRTWVPGDGHYHWLRGPINPLPLEHRAHSSDILSIGFKHTRILRIFGFFKKYLKILDTKANFQAFVFL